MNNRVVSSYNDVISSRLFLFIWVKLTFRTSQDSNTFEHQFRDFESFKEQNQADFVFSGDIVGNK